MNKHLKQWREFSKEVENHILRKKDTYHLSGTEELLDMMPDEFVIGSIVKYAVETLNHIKRKSFPDRATLFSIAHLTQVLERRMFRASTTTEKQEV